MTPEEKDRIRQRTGKGKVRNKLRNAIKCGWIDRPTTCECCGHAGLIHAHHFDYTKPFNVQWLCNKCHVSLHIRLKLAA